MIEEKGVGPDRGEGEKGERVQHTVLNDFSVGYSRVGQVGVGRLRLSPVLLLLIICSVSPSTPLVSFRKWTPIFVAVAQSKYLASSRLFCFLASSHSAFGRNSPGFLR